MAFDFAKFDKSIDLEGLKNDVAQAAENNSDFKEVPVGKYEVEINKLELKTSKNGDPMLSCWMKIVDGDYENLMLFMNQVVTKGFQIHIVNEFLRSLVEGMDIEVEFISYAQYAELILDISEKIDGEREYLVDYSEKNGFSTFKIEKVFELE